MTKSHYARSIKLECELEQVKKQRDALLVALKESTAALSHLQNKLAVRVNPPTLENAIATIASVEATKGE